MRGTIKHPIEPYRRKVKDVSARNPIFKLGEILNEAMTHTANYNQTSIIEVTGKCGTDYIIEMRVK